MAGLKLSLLGPFAASVDGRPISNFRTRATQALLVYLACQPEIAHRREHLMNLLGPGLPKKSAQANLRQTLYQLRQMLLETAVTDDGDPVPFLLSNWQTIQINPEASYKVDALTFESMLQAGEVRWGEAVELYRGDFLADFYLPGSAPFEEWTHTYRGGLKRLMLAALHSLTAQHLSRGALNQAEPTARRQIKMDNLQEPAHRQLLEILARDGRRVDALAQYENLAHLLQTELGVEPSTETQDLYATIRAGDLDKVGTDRKDVGIVTPPPPALITKPSPHNLPSQANPFVGREVDLNALDNLLANPDIRLVTIVGPGGMGKTRLSLACAERQLETNQSPNETTHKRFPEGVFMVPLAAVTNIEYIAPPLAKALNFQFQGNEPLEQQILNYLRQKKLLLLFDNFEHLLAGVGLLSDILVGAPDVCILVTSRERLKLQAEQVYSIQGFDYREWQSVVEAEEDAVVQLFLSSARRILPEFVLKPEHLRPLWHICQLVQGMPLGIVLAAAWIELLSPAKIAAEIRSSLDILKADYSDLPLRQQSMRTVLHTTWERLTPSEQTIFGQLSLFHGGFSVDAARAVTGTSLNILLKLVEKSLLFRSGTGRFEVHELLRQFAAEQLGHSLADQEVTSERHAVYFCQRLQQYEPDLKGNRARIALEEIDIDIENSQAAWNWAVNHRQYALIRQAMFSLATFYLVYGRFQVGLKLFESTEKQIVKNLAPVPSADVDGLLVRVCLLAWQCVFIFELGLPQRAIQRGQEARTILETSLVQAEEPRYERALVLLHLGDVYAGLDRHEEAASCLGESLVLFQDLGEDWGMAQSAQSMAGIALKRGKYKSAIKRFREARRYEARDNKRSIANLQLWEGMCQIWLGELLEGERMVRQSLTIFQEMGDQKGAGWALEGLGQAAAFRGAFEESRVILSESITLHTAIGMKNRLAGSTRYWCWATMLQGEYELAHTRLQTSLDIFRVSGMPYGMGACLFVGGSLSLVQGEWRSARKQLMESAAILQDAGQRDDLSFVLAVLSCTHTMEQNMGQARQHLNEALHLVQEIHGFQSVLYILSAAALFLSENGQTSLAVEVYAGVSHYPFIANSKWFNDVVGRRLAETAVTLSPDVVDSAMARGQEMDLWKTVDTLHVELSKQT